VRKLTFILLFVIAFVKVNAQFIIAGQYTANDYFHDVMPDSTFIATGSSLPALYPKPIDINGDGIIDFDLVSYKGGGMGNPYRSVYITAKNNNEMLLQDTSVCTYSNAPGPCCGTVTAMTSKPLILGDSVKAKGKWYQQDQYALIQNWCGVGYFNDTNDNFFGVRVFKGNDTLYGWIKIKIEFFSSYMGFILEEFACNRGTSIGIKEYSDNSSIKLYPNPANSKVDIVLNVSPSDIKIKIVNSLGQIIFEDKKTNSDKFNLDVSGYSNGIYFVEVESSQGVLRTKFVKE
jgi:hypothetical protein